MGGKGFCAFRDVVAAPTSFCKAFLQAEKYADLVTDATYPDLPALNDVRLEELVAGAIVAASRHNGFGGLKHCEFGDFLGALMFELSMKNDFLGLVNILSSLSVSVPNCLPLDTGLPAFLDKASFGSMKRTRETDFTFAGGKVSVECVGHLTPQDELKYAINRVPPDSTVHFIIARARQKMPAEGQQGDDDIDVLVKGLSRLHFAAFPRVFFLQIDGVNFQEIQVTPMIKKTEQEQGQRLADTQNKELSSEYEEAETQNEPYSCCWRTGIDLDAIKLVIFLELPAWEQL